MNTAAGLLKAREIAEVNRKAQQTPLRADIGQLKGRYPYDHIIDVLDKLIEHAQEYNL